MVSGRSWYFRSQERKVLKADDQSNKIRFEKNPPDLETRKLLVSFANAVSVEHWKQRSN